MKDFIYKKILYYLIILVPIFNIITGFINIDIILKLVIMILSIIYLLFIDKKHFKSNLILLIILFIFSFLNIINNIYIVRLSIYNYFSNYLKYLYHIILLLFLIRSYKELNFKLYQFRNPLLIIIFSFFLGKIINYQLFSSTFELSSLLGLLFPIALYNAFHNEDGIILDKIIFILTGIILLLIGTKTGLFSYIIVIISYLIIRLTLIKKKKLDKVFIIILLCLIIVPIFNYFNNYKDILNYQNKSSIIEKNNSLYDNIIGKMKIDSKSNNIFLVNNDYLNIYFMYGFIGLFIILIGYTIIFIKFINNIIKSLKEKNNINFKYIVINYAIILELGISFVFGYSLLSPLVSTYLVLLGSIAFYININDNKNNKKSILLSNNSNFIKKFDTDKYDLYYLSKIDNKIMNNRLILYLFIKNKEYDYIIGDNSISKIDQFILKHSNGEKVLIGKKNNKYFKRTISKMDINEL